MRPSDQLFEEEHPDVVVNFAAESHVDRSIEDPGVFLQTNIIGTAGPDGRLPQVRHRSAIIRFPPTRSMVTCRWTGRICSLRRRRRMHTSSPYSASKAER